MGGGRGKKSAIGGAIGLTLGALLAIPTGGASLAVMPAIATAAGIGGAVGASAGMASDIHDAEKAAKTQRDIINNVPSTVAEVPTIAKAEIQAVAKASSKRSAVARSRSIFTSPLGIGGITDSVKKTLLGN